MVSRLVGWSMPVFAELSLVPPLRTPQSILVVTKRLHKSVSVGPSVSMKVLRFAF